MPTDHEKADFCDFLKNIEQTLSTWKMVQAGDTILVGVSGGPDSVALLHALHWLSSRLAVTLGVAHVNHQLRADESDADEAFVKSLAGKMQLPFHSRRCDVRQYAKSNRMSLEDAARRVRYDFFSELAAMHQYTKVATAHHMDDNAELVLMNLLRGSGKSGISGIRPVHRKQVIRPLIHVSKQEILAFLARYRLTYRIDQSNQDESFTRNRIRNHLIPVLQSDYNPRITEAVNRLAAISQMEEAWIDSIVDRETKNLILDKGGPGIRISISGFMDRPLPLQRRIVRNIINKVKGDLYRITMRHVDDIIALISNSVADSELHLPDQLLVCIADRRACFMLQARIARPARVRIRQSDDPVYTHVVSSPDELPRTIRISETGAAIRFSILDRTDLPEPETEPPSWAFMDLACIVFPLTIRNPMPGDRFSPLGMDGRQRISRYFSNQKIPRQTRSQYPVVLSREQIIWLSGHRIDDAVKVTPTTNRILKAELFLA